MNRVLLHVDMDAFFAAVEFLHHPEWRGKPLIVGAKPNERGVVSTCSYEARKFGVRSAMPSRKAYQLCPHAIFTHPHMSLYEEASNKVFEIFSHYSPFVEGISIDEAFLDVTGNIHLHGSPQELATKLRKEVREKCGLTCSVGIAINRLLAKIGSDENKPDGQTDMPSEPDAIATFLSSRPLGILWGVGKKMREILMPYGLITCGDIQKMVNREPRDVWENRIASAPPALASLLGETSALALANAVFGISDDVVHWEESHEKSVSREYTFDVDVSNRDVVREQYLKLVIEVGRRFRREVRWARTARLKLRDTNFQTITRQIQFMRPSRDDLTFREAALELFDATIPKGTSRSIRLIGFGVANIQETPDDGELLLFEDPAVANREKRERLSEALDNLRDLGLM